MTSELLLTMVRYWKEEVEAILFRFVFSSSFFILSLFAPRFRREDLHTFRESLTLLY